MKLMQRSRAVSSSQSGVHPRLSALLKRQQGKLWRQPLHAPSVHAFEALEAMLPDPMPPLVLDSGCGTGQSTLALAKMLPDCLVIGVDKSEARLARGGVTKPLQRDGNAIRLRAELETIWRLALERGWRLQRHYLLYPNPWPKPGQLQRRWHAHPVFPNLLALGGRLELRCNWEPYAREFAFAVNHFCGANVAPEPVGKGPPLSPFERKYRNSGLPLYSVVLSSSSSRVN